LANVNFTFGRHLKLVDLDWTSFENCNGKFNGIDNIEIFRMSGFNCADINLNMIHGNGNTYVAVLTFVFNALDLGPCDEFVTIVDNNRDMFEFECNTCICLEIFDISRESLEDELLVPYISSTGSCFDSDLFLE
jgi:hypothetical protein